MMKTMHGNAWADGIRNVLVSPEVRALLPDVLIDYLWKLALCENWRGLAEQRFVLEAGELGGRDVQDILHAGGQRTAADTRRVYGVEPVDCTLLVLRAGSGHRMTLCAN